jgi:hypothetical protein
MPTLEGKSDVDKCLWVLVTTLTNFTMIPGCIVVWRQKRNFPFFLGWFAMITSFLYHLCDSVEGSLWLTEGEWHRLDNIGAIGCFAVWFVHLANIKDRAIEEHFYFLSFALVLMCQEKDPWNLGFTVGPLVITLLCTVLKWVLVDGALPPFSPYHMKRVLICLGFAGCCFVPALDDENDPYRIFHGFWHFWVGIASYYSWQILPTAKVCQLSTGSDHCNKI